MRLTSPVPLASFLSPLGAWLGLVWSRTEEEGQGQSREHSERVTYGSKYLHPGRCICRAFVGASHSSGEVAGLAGCRACSDSSTLHVGAAAAAVCRRPDCTQFAWTAINTTCSEDERRQEREREKERYGSEKESRSRSRSRSSSSLLHSATYLSIHSPNCSQLLRYSLLRSSAPGVLLGLVTRSPSG